MSTKSSTRPRSLKSAVRKATKHDAQKIADSASAAIMASLGLAGVEPYAVLHAQGWRTTDESLKQSGVSRCMRSWHATLQTASEAGKLDTRLALMPNGRLSRVWRAKG